MVRGRGRRAELIISLPRGATPKDSMLMIADIEATAHVILSEA